MADRSGGVLLHPTSLPGSSGIGDLGSVVQSWIDWLLEAGCRLWQILPLGPTGYGDSPYQSLSSFAGNPLLISLDQLVEEGLLLHKDLEPRLDCSPDRVDFNLVFAYKEKLLALAADNYREGKAQHLEDGFRSFCQSHAAWLDDFALFMTLKNVNQGTPWTAWAQSLAKRQPEALAGAKEQYKDEIEEQRFRQFLFFRQWEKVRQHAAEAGITIIGDIPIYTAHDSSDVWANPELFQLDEVGEPLVVGGVPPDYFSPTGQRWGNPLYHWDVLETKGFSWWIERFLATFRMVDVVRLDHFRGLEAYWEIPGDAPTAEKGQWVTGPGATFLQAIREGLGGLPIIAEDLGFITPGVIALRDEFDLPGMKILQFGFSGDPAHEFLPHNYPRHCVAYTGTHDNDTARGWYESVSEHERAFCRSYLGSDGTDIAWDMLRALWASVADWVVAPLQDVLGLGGEARMNFPGTVEGNWRWRVTEEQLSLEVAKKLHDLNFVYSRLPSVN